MAIKSYPYHLKNTCLLCGLKKKLKDGYCKVCQEINDVIRKIRDERKKK